MTEEGQKQLQCPKNDKITIIKGNKVQAKLNISKIFQKASLNKALDTSFLKQHRVTKPAT